MRLVQIEQLEFNGWGDIKIKEKFTEEIIMENYIAYMEQLELERMDRIPEY